MEECNGEIDVYSGDDAVVVPYLSLGAKGVISVLSNIAPKDTHEMVIKYLQGDIKGSLELQLRYHALIKALFLEVNPIPIKKALDLCDWETGGLRLPLTELEPEHTKILKEQMLRLGILTAE